jgi:cytidylate kinase
MAGTGLACSAEEERAMPIVTISRGSKSGGKALADLVSARLGAPCVGREILVEAAAKLGVSEETISDKMIKGPKFWDRFSFERHTYVAAVQAALAEYAAGGSLVYHGVAGHMLLRGLPAVLRVRLIAPLEMRIRAVMDEQKVSREEAERHIRRIDEERERWTKYMYGAYLLDPQLYDLVVNLETMALESACAIVVEAASRSEYTVTREAHAKLQDFALESRIKLALMTSPATRSLELGVAATGGIVTITGEIPESTMLTRTRARWEQEFNQIAESVTGIRQLVLNVRPLEGTS